MMMKYLEVENMQKVIQDPKDLMSEQNIRIRDAIIHKMAWFCE